MDINISTMTAEFTKDFETLLSKIDSSKYSPCSNDFKNAVLTGLMAFLLKKEPVISSVETDEVKEEMDSAEKYYQRYKSTGDAMYKQMALEELRHGDYLLRQHMLMPMNEAEKAKYEKYGEWIKSYMSKVK